jgi:hypothetical protein
MSEQLFGEEKLREMVKRTLDWLGRRRPSNGS